MSQNVLEGLLRRLENLSEEEKERLRKVPRLTPEERERAREALQKGYRFISIPNPDPDIVGGLEEWEKEALEHLSNAEVAQYTIARLNALRPDDDAL